MYLAPGREIPQALKDTLLKVNTLQGYNYNVFLYITNNFEH